MIVTRAVADLHNAGLLESQLLFGESFSIEKTENGKCFGQADCGYSGWVEHSSLGPKRATTHRICSLASFAYTAPDLKSKPIIRLSFGSKITVLSNDSEFTKTPGGYIYTAHLCEAPAVDFVTEAEKFMHIPYLWAGRSSLGIDCSGLVQLVLDAAGIPIPRDSGPQEIATGFTSVTRMQRGDLVFWKGHVAIAQDSQNIIHANAFTMSVASEPLTTAKSRILAAGGGDITAIRRVAR